jgi:hypothetical protein
MQRSFLRRAVTVVGTVSLSSLSLLFVGGGLSTAANASATVSTSNPGSAVRVTPTHQTLKELGTVNFSQAAAADLKAATTTGSGTVTAKYIVGDSQTITRTTAGPGVYTPQAPVTNLSVKSSSSSSLPGVTGVLGMTGKSQALANQAYDLEPPDQGLCSSGQYTMEMVNNALSIASATTKVLEPPTPTTALFAIPSETNGSFVSDPHCYYDASLQRWFAVELSIPGFFVPGYTSTTSQELIAVSQTSNPLGNWTTFAIDSTDPTGAGCPCFGDYPMIGTDANGFYLTTNEFSISGPNFNGVQLYAMSKWELANAANGVGPMPTVEVFNNLPSPFPGETTGETYHLSPALAPEGGSFDMSNDGTEYFTMSDAFPLSSNQLAVYAMTNTGSLSNATPSVTLTSTTVTLGQYYEYPAAGMSVRQPAPMSLSQVPLRAEIAAKTGVVPPGGVIQSDFDAAQETTYVNGQLYTELSSASSPTAAIGTTTAQWYVLNASAPSGMVAASLANEGNVGVSGASVLYPDLAVNSMGQGDMVFTLVGGGYYPSAAFVAFNSNGPVGPVTVAKAGTGPEDGFTCYSYYTHSNAGCRWGDFSGATAVNNKIVMATEFIPPASTRDHLTNWGTYVFSAPAGQPVTP